jgi:S1-C subfamily serine protease
MANNFDPKNKSENQPLNTVNNDGLLWSQPKETKTERINDQFIGDNIGTQKYNQYKKSKPFLSTVNSFFRSVGVFTVLLVLLISGIFGYTLWKPQNDLSKWVVRNTVLKNYLTTGDSSNSSGAIINQETATNITGFLGLGDTNTNFQFAKPSEAKTSIQVVQIALPSVLSLSVREDSSRLGVSSLVSGTGFIVSEDGLVVTNKHVIASKCNDTSNSIKISGLSHDQKAYELELVSVDPVDDIAILKIKNTTNIKFSAVKFGDNNTTPVGSEVIAIGNVLGQLQNTVTKGIISGTNRTVETSKSDAIDDDCTLSKVTFIDNLIQTDAAINKGNSGGPLFDSSGLLVGMNTLGTTDSQNIGFAISSNLILTVLNNYKQTGNITRPRLGIYSRPITPLQKQESDWLPEDYGEILLNPSEVESAISKGSPAEKVGLQAGDVILQVNGEKLKATDQNPSPLRRAILSRKPEEEITLTVKKAVSGDAVSGFKYEAQNKDIKVILGSISFSIK